MLYDYVVVGAGLFGSVFAREMKDAGKNVLVIEKRGHIGGNCFSSEFEDTDITVHGYGTHIFHTESEKVWKYINRFTAFNRYQHRVLTAHKGRVYTLPINLGTINSFYGLNLKPTEVESFLKEKIVPNENPRNFEEKAISLIGPELYEAFIKGYSIKQWNADLKHIPADVIARLPVRTSYYDSYFDDVYQGLPLDGYYAVFKNLLKDIPVELNTDFFEDRGRWISRCKRLVYTGPIDEYFGYRYGKLRWRSVRFETDLLGIPDFQGTSVMNFADVDVPYTRIHEPKHLHRERKFKIKKTVILREYSQDDPTEPYYPVRFSDDLDLLEKYNILTSEEPQVIFGGRLAEYKYLDMDDTIESALAKAENILK